MIERNSHNQPLVGDLQLSTRALNSMSTHIAIVDREGNIIFVNEAWKKFSLHNGAPDLLKTCIGENYFHVFQKAIAAGVIEAPHVYVGLQKVIKGDIPRFVTEYPCDSPDETRWFLLVADPLGHPPQGLVITHCNFTERKLQELNHLQRQVDLYKEAKSANVAKSEFLAIITHEIRTPLSAIAGFSELLTQSTDLDGVQRLYFEKISSNIQHLKSLVDDILDWSKLESGHLNIEKEFFSFRDEIEKTFSSFQEQASNRNLSFELCYTGLIPQSIYSDPKRFRQILYNLISNAIKFTDRGFVKILINGERIDKSSSEFLGVKNSFYPLMNLNIRFIDSGVGIPSEYHPTIFDAFNQGGRALMRDLGGSGIGLSISRKLAQALDGQIELVSSTPDQGSEFVLSLPQLPFR